MTATDLVDDLSTNLPKELRERVQAADKKMQDLLDKLILEIESEPIPPILFHYTDGAGLRGILEERKLWLTNIFYLNDPSELRHGISFASEALASTAQSASKPLSEFSRIFSEFQVDGIERAIQLFVACFSAERDDLGQWRAYANDGGGYAIGFDSKALEGAFLKAGMSPSTFPIRHQDERLKEIQAALVAEVVPIIQQSASMGIPNAAGIGLLKVLAVMLSLHVITASLFFKHPAYKSEIERRYLRMQRSDKQVNDLKVRVRKDALISYVEFDWRRLGDDVVKEIVVGPAAQSGIGERFARDCLRAFSFSATKIRVEKSKVPYRGG